MAFGLWLAGICVLSSMSGPQLEPAFEFLPGDKFAHFVAFALGGALLAVALKRSFAMSWSRVIGLSVLSVGLFAAVDEWHQTFTPGRSGGDIGDWTADMLGAATGAVITSLGYGKIRRHRED